MIINLTEKERLKWDGLQFHLQKPKGFRTSAAGEKTIRWESVMFFQSPWKALGYIIENDLFCLEGEFPPTVLEPVFEKLNELQTTVETMEVNFNNHLKGCQGVVGCPLRKVRSIHTQDK